jgi:hypothetical protein
MESNRSKSYLFLLINSTVLFIVANILETTLHESAHFLAAIAMKAQNVVLFHNHVVYSFTGQSISQYREIIVCAAGPIFSLLIGFIFHIICSNRFRKDLWFMFFNYMSIFGYIGFFGYLMIAPFFAEGDTGFIFMTLHFPAWTVLVIALAALIVMYLIMARLTGNFVSMSPAEAIETKRSRIQFMYILVLIPVLLGIVCTTLLNLPVIGLLSLLAPILRPFTILWTFHLAVGKDYPEIISNDQFASINKPNVFVFVAVVITVLVNRLLVFGLTY